MKGFKVFGPDFKCRDFQYEENKVFEISEELKMCRNGIHFCEKAVNCFNYYSFDPSNIVCEVEALGEVVTEDDKSATNRLLVGKRLTWEEVLGLVNTGDRNTGYSNTGNYNTGNSNTGNRNTGNSNTGNRNTGHQNTGNRNTGHQNTGDWNTGHFNTGYRNTGRCNTDNYNTGNRNTGHQNTGDWNTGNQNTGHSNTGNCNTGYSNAGHCNTGNRNTGDCNTGNYNTGHFNTDEPTVRMFNKDTGKKRDEITIPLINFKLTEWIPLESMSEQEKKDRPTAETAGGYLKTRTYYEAWAKAWEEADEQTKKAFTELPNFDPEIFKEITGINVTT